MNSLVKKPLQALKSSQNSLVAKATIRALNFHEGEIVYVRTTELVSDTSDWLRSFPRRYDAVVGIPRAGLIPATIISTQLGVPLTIPYAFPRGFASKDVFDSPPRDALVVDDASGHGEGGTMDLAIKQLQAKSPGTRFWKASTYVKESCAKYFDLYFRVIGDKGHFVCEWNIQHDKNFNVVGMDMDGVLCEECPEDADRDEAKYADHLLNARPRLIPSYQIDCVVTGRLEKYRSATENWLAKQGVNYKQLVMWGVEDKQQRTDPAAFKARELLRVKPGIYYESRHDEAIEIRRRTGIHVYCYQHMCFVGQCP